jgi:ArsR family transcriptional regulator
MNTPMPTPARFFRILADETRLSILLLLTRHDELCVCELVETLHLSQPKISRHLALLKSSGLVRDQRQGQWVYYRLSATMPQWCRYILETSLQQSRLPPLNPITSSGKNRCAQ